MKLSERCAVRLQGNVLTHGWSNREQSGDGSSVGAQEGNMWCLQCASDRTQSLLELETDSW